MNVVIFQDQPDERDDYGQDEESVAFMPLRFCFGKLHQHHPIRRQWVP
jgi:hypothetical protein